MEVQDRSSRVDINTFNGWLVKLEEIGAQHLICVSRHDFPSSIREKASELGSKVMLVKLQGLVDPDAIPLQLFNSVGVYDEFDMNSIENLSVNFSKEDVVDNQLTENDLNILPFKVNDKIFRDENRTPINLFMLVRKYAQDINYHVGQPATFCLNNTQKLFAQIDDCLIRIKEMTFDFEWTHTINELKPTVISYEQEGDTLVWLLEYHYIRNGESQSFRIPFTGDAKHLQTELIQFNINHDISFSLDVIKED